MPDNHEVSVNASLLGEDGDLSREPMVIDVEALQGADGAPATLSSPKRNQP